MSILIGAGAKQRKLSDSDAIKLTSGRDFWSTESLGGIPSIRMSDGPHGLRYQATKADHLGINEAVPATAFPTASASASTWDPELLERMGHAIGTEARSMDVDIVLGPGVNIKRNPLGGRNFEYFSEDPLLAGKLAAGWIHGLQATGVGASLKHFAGNSQETARLRSDSLIDPVALHELYLEAFRIAVTEAQPESVMVAYNMINGTYMSDNAYLLNDVLRGQWGFKGLVVTDWGALNDKVASLNAGTDLEMPTSGHLFDKQATTALASGKLDRQRLTRAVSNIAAVADAPRPTEVRDRTTMLTYHAKIAQKIAENGAVLMKNDGILPLQAGRKLAVIGALADKTRIQGAGSSHISTPESISILNGLDDADRPYTYAQGYQLNGEPDATLRSDAVKIAAEAEDVVLVLGLPDTAEAEGADRQTMDLPANQIALLQAVSAANPNVAVLLNAGSVVTMTWQTQAKAILNLFLGGQRIGAAAEQLLFGDATPSGKLAETYPLAYEDVPSSAHFGSSELSVPYVESLYAGYRYYDKAQMPVAFPFGFGLSYTTFALSDAQLATDTLTASDKTLALTVTVKNIGAVRGAEVVQVYAGQNEQKQLAPLHSLAAFSKVWLDPGASTTVTLNIPRHAFERWDEDKQAFTLAGGQWTLSVGTSSRDFAASLPVQVDAPSFLVTAPTWYEQPQGKAGIKDFTSLTGMQITANPLPKRGNFNRLSTPRELATKSMVSRSLAKRIIANMQKGDNVSPDSPEGQFLATIVWDTPIIRLAQQSGGSLKLGMIDSLIFLANH